MYTKNSVYLALVHYPVLNQKGEIISTSITPFDLHDIARTAKTYALAGYFIVCPVESQRVLAQRIMDHWLTGVGGEMNSTRREAFQLVRLSESIEDVRLTISQETDKSPRLIATSAKKTARSIAYKQLKQDFKESDSPHLLLFGTGWGLTPEVLEQVEATLEPIEGGGDGSYNHLPVRAAVAIILDRLLGKDI